MLATASASAWASGSTWSRYCRTAVSGASGSSSVPAAPGLPPRSARTASRTSWCTKRSAMSPATSAAQPASRCKVDFSLTVGAAGIGTRSIAATRSRVRRRFDDGSERRLLDEVAIEHRELRLRIGRRRVQLVHGGDRPARLGGEPAHAEVGPEHHLAGVAHPVEGGLVAGGDRLQRREHLVRIGELGLDRGVVDRPGADRGRPLDVGTVVEQRFDAPAPVGRMGGVEPSGQLGPAGLAGFVVVQPPVGRQQHRAAQQLGARRRDEVVLGAPLRQQHEVVRRAIPPEALDADAGPQQLLQEHRAAVERPQVHGHHVLHAARRELGDAGGTGRARPASSSSGCPWSCARRPTARRRAGTRPGARAGARTPAARATTSRGHRGSCRASGATR